MTPDMVWQLGEMKQPTCPLCGSWPEVFLPVQAFCSNDDCEALLWDTSVSAAANLADIQRAKWTEGGAP